MKLLYNNGSLGRQGKSTLAYTHYNYSQSKNYKFYTNDIGQCSINNIDKLIPKERLFCFDKDENITFRKSDNIIFDFGGKPDDRLIPVIKNVDCVVIPISYQSISELKITAKNINTISQYNKNIVLVITNTESEFINKVANVLKKHFGKYKIFTVKKSKFIIRLANYGKTVFDIAKENKGDKGHLERIGLLNQFSQLYDYLDEINL